MTTMPVEPDMFVTSGFGPRSGGYHYGTDFGANGGSGGRAVYAARAGKVVMCGAASGFGQWVVVDHPEGGTTVYGHVIPEVTLGQQVSEGQRIARINPDPATNGGVAPHLHMEWHRYVWVPPGPDRIDPMTMLAGAKSPGGQPEHTPPPAWPGGTLFGVDVSEHQNGMSLQQASREGIAFAIIRTTDGTYRDRTYRSHLDDAESAGLITAAYHYMRSPSEGTTIAQQVQASIEVMGDARRPVWLDCETDAGLSVEDIREAKRCYESHGVRVIGVYSYVPWWENRVREGEPDTHEFGAVWVAAYGANLGGRPADIYPGDAHKQWSYPLGNQKPVIWQFGSNGHVSGFTQVDVNAFKGTRDQLHQLFYGQGQTPAESENDMLRPDERDALNECKLMLQELAEERESFINPAVRFRTRPLLGIIDATGFAILALLKAIAKKHGIDPDQIINDAIQADREAKK